MFAHLNLAPSCSDEPVAKGSSCRDRNVDDVSELDIPHFASIVPLQQVEHSQLGCISRSPAPSRYSSSPPSSPSSAVPASAAASSSNLSDAEDNDFPLTPHSKQSGGALYVANPSESAQAGVGLPTPSRSPLSKTNIILTDFWADLSTTSIPWKISARSHIEWLSAQSVHCAVHYKEAVRERKRMRWYTAHWEVAEIQRLHTLVRSLCDESETEFMMADRESRWLLDILIKQQTSPILATHAQYASATCDNDKRSLHLADAELSLLANRSQFIEQ
ncbi:hypothetical protein F4604DRAFT_1920132 [Suillus subluteus]|nr:hypothetical protein F4604DRAFT_1920132 [Suillus subluteus]